MKHFTIPSHVAWQSIAGEMLIVDLQRSRTLGLNAAGSFLWERIASSSGESLSAALSHHFSIEQARADCDVRAFVEDLSSRGLLEEKP